MPGSREGKKGSKIGRNRRQPSKVKYTAKAGLLKNKRPFKKGSNKPPQPTGFMLPEHSTRVQVSHHIAIVVRPHLANELMEHYAINRSAAQGARSRDDAHSLTRQLRQPFRTRALAVSSQVVKDKGVKTTEY